MYIFKTLKTLPEFENLLFVETILESSYSEYECYFFSLFPLRECPSAWQYTGANPVPVPIKHLVLLLSWRMKCPSGSIPEKVVPTSASHIIGLPRHSAIRLIIRVKVSPSNEAIEYARLSPGASWNMTYCPCFGYSLVMSGHE